MNGLLTVAFEEEEGTYFAIANETLRTASIFTTDRLKEFISSFEDSPQSSLNYEVNQYFIRIKLIVPLELM